MQKSSPCLHYYRPREGPGEIGVDGSNSVSTSLAGLAGELGLDVNTDIRERPTGITNNEVLLTLSLLATFLAAFPATRLATGPVGLRRSSDVTLLQTSVDRTSRHWIRGKSSKTLKCTVTSCSSCFVGLFGWFYINLLPAHQTHPHRPTAWGSTAFYGYKYIRYSRWVNNILYSLYIAGRFSAL